MAIGPEGVSRPEIPTKVADFVHLEIASYTERMQSWTDDGLNARQEFEGFRAMYEAHTGQPVDARGQAALMYDHLARRLAIPIFNAVSDVFRQPGLTPPEVERNQLYGHVLGAGLDVARWVQGARQQGPVEFDSVEMVLSALGKVVEAPDSAALSADELKQVLLTSQRPQ
jgi:hypothetical protein